MLYSRFLEQLQLFIIEQQPPPHLLLLPAPGNHHPTLCSKALQDRQGGLCPGYLGLARVLEGSEAFRQHTCISFISKGERGHLLFPF